MAIHTRCAEAILDGRNKVEFRRRAITADVQTVSVYATAPISRIVADFGVADVVGATPSYLSVAIRGAAGRPTRTTAHAAMGATPSVAPQRRRL